MYVDNSNLVIQPIVCPHMLYVAQNLLKIITEFKLKWACTRNVTTICVYFSPDNLHSVLCTTDLKGIKNINPYVV